MKEREGDRMEKCLTIRLVGGARGSLASYVRLAWSGGVGDAAVE
jgi:hypothetical protein